MIFISGELRRRRVQFAVIRYQIGPDRLYSRLAKHRDNLPPVVCRMVHKVLHRLVQHRRVGITFEILVAERALDVGVCREFSAKRKYSMLLKRR